MNDKDPTPQTDSAAPSAATPKAKRTTREDGKSPFRAATRPSVPLYFPVSITLPLWRKQMPALFKIAGHMRVPPPDLMAFAAMAFVAQFPTKEALFAALEEACERYAIQGNPVELPFPLSWPDTPSGMASAESERKGRLFGRG